MSLDIGPETEKRYADAIEKSTRLVFWNGPMGVFEFPTFALTAPGAFILAKR